jgi:hypothetical protein
VAWDQLRGAYGSAEEVGELLGLIESGEDVWGDLFSHVLHQGSIFEATVPVIAWVIEALKQDRLGVGAGTKKRPSQRVWGFAFLSGAAGSATGLARRDSVASAVLDALRKGIALYQKGLADTEPEIRVASAAIWKAVATDRALAFASIDRQYKLEADSEVRVALLSAMKALAAAGRKWSDRLLLILDTDASDRERFYAAAYLARRLGAATPESVAVQMAELFARLPEPGYVVELTNVEEPDDLFWESVRAMERSAAVACLAKALELRPDGNGLSAARETVRLMEWLLRLVSNDERGGWGSTTSSRGPKIEYFGVKPVSNAGDWLHSTEARVAIEAIVNKKEVWRIQTNLLSLFGLPSGRQELRGLIGGL